MLTINNTLDGYLKDVEILGNTIQDAENLADIRSVGDKVEGQELYEIPVLSCGKNLFNGKIQKGYWYNGSLKSSEYAIANIEDISVKTSTTYNISIQNYSSFIYVVELNEDKQEIKSTQIGGGKGTFTTTTGNYIRFCSNNSSSTPLGLDAKVQLEEGTVVTEYEPYVEDKLTILSPTPLEKVGDVADRLIEKDGVWGVEKNIKTDLLCGANNEDFRLNKTLAKGGYQFTWGANMGAIANKNSEVISSTMKSYVSSNEDYSSNIWIYDGNTYVIHHPTISTRDEIKLWLQTNPTIVKFPTNTPQFIPLPHDQQVKLRTFANKTNISFGCEIEGTIKAQVPKSLGATVNTHTEQISNLNKELDRVKKLEESTVSTVTTESDFTTVEATSNGYFEDVKLEGRTLVNKLNPISNITESDTTFSAYTNTILEPSVYTIINNSAKEIFFNVNNASNGSYITTITLKANEKSKILKYDVQVKIVNFGGKKDMGWSENNKEDLGKQIVLEGDHTQNPPSYFEGLKSVGDGADEIVVSSVKGDGNLIPTFDGFIVENNSNNSVVITDTKIEGIPSVGGFKVIKPTYLNEGSYTCSTDGHAGINVRVRILNTDRSIKIANVVNQSFTIDKSGLYIVSIENNGNTETSFSIEGLYIYKYGKQKPDLYSYQTDKKRLLYYNEETQTWEKPILREWDSIEKHSDGKYYYHVRSKEGDYVEGDESLNDCITDLTVSVKKLAEEKVYECTNIDLITYANETNYIVESGAIAPKSTLKVHNNISNVVSLLQKKVSLLESNITKYMITQNRMQLASTYSADSVTFKVDYFSLCGDEENYNEDLYNLILNNILVGKDNYDYDKMFTMILDYASWNQISWEQFDILVGLMDMQHNPPIEEIPTDDEIVEEIPNEIM